MNSSRRGPSKVKSRTLRTRSSAPKGPSGHSDAMAAHEVGQPLRSRLIAIERAIGLFSQQDSFAADSRFNHPVMLEPNSSMPQPMADLFSDDLAALDRLGRKTDICHRFDLKGCRIFCYPYFNYDGFQALVGLEKQGDFIAGWKEEEALQPDTPRVFHSRKSAREIASLLDDALGEGEGSN